MRTVLREIGADDVPELLAFNKADLAPSDAARLAERHAGSVAFSAATGEGVDDLLRADRRPPPGRSPTSSSWPIPYDRGDVLAAVHREGEVLVEHAGDDAMRLRVRLRRRGSLGQFVDVRGRMSVPRAVRPAAVPLRPARRR